MPANVSEKVRLSNPALLTWAREAAGYTVPEIAQYLRKPAEDIAAWESGADAPRYRQLEKLAHKLKRPLSAFFLPEVPAEPPPPADFRALPGAQPGQYAPETRLAVRSARGLLADVRELSDAAGYSLRMTVPSFAMGDDPETAAPRVRSILGVSVADQCAWRDQFHALDVWRDVLFDRGVIAAVFRFPMDDARAFSLVADDLGGIGLNSSDVGYARVFSLFHEFYHLCLGMPGVSGGDPRLALGARREAAVERRCNRFAASLLLPTGEPEVRDALAELRSTPSPATGERLARRLKVSKYAILGRLLDLGLIDEARHWSLVAEWKAAEPTKRQPSSGGDYVRMQVSRPGKRFTSLVLDALDGGGISRYEASSLLALDPRHFDKARAYAEGGLHAG
jgi:Zn-dependent peptidase ImmA (M78 family)/transcriptional regulator with XRE-family HTH domain